MPEPLLAVRDLRITLPDGTPAVHGLSFELPAGAALALVGESGAGKSLTVRAVLGLLPDGVRATGSIRLEGTELLGAPRSVYRSVWGRRIGHVPQDALAVLSPVHTVGAQLAAVLGISDRREARRRAAAALEEVGIPAERLAAYPHEFSGGMRQRVVLAMAMAGRPALLVADEPTTALDPTAQARVLGLIGTLRERTSTGLLLVTHDLGVVAAHTDRAVVLRDGRAVDSGPVRQVLGSHRHPYTASLLAALPGGSR